MNMMKNISKQKTLYMVQNKSLIGICRYDSNQTLLQLTPTWLQMF